MRALHLERRIGNPKIPTPTVADSSFGKYGPMDGHEVRKADVTGQSLAEQVKKTREMLREMTPEKALEIIEFHCDLNFFEALALAKQEGRLIVPNDVHDRILTKLTGRKDQKYLEENYPVWTGTLVIYEKPDTPFGEQVVFQGITFIFPEHFRGKRNCVLVVEHPDFDLVDLGHNHYELKVSDEKIHLIENFSEAKLTLTGNILTGIDPEKDYNYYNPHAEIKLPQGEPVAESKESRCVWRIDSAYLGPLVQCFRGSVVLSFLDLYRSNKKVGSIYSQPTW